MVEVHGYSVQVEVKPGFLVSMERVSKEEFEKSIDIICDLLKEEVDDIFHFMQNYDNGNRYEYQLSIRK